MVCRGELCQKWQEREVSLDKGCRGDVADMAPLRLERGGDGDGEVMMRKRAAHFGY